MTPTQTDNRLSELEKRQALWELRSDYLSNQLDGINNNLASLNTQIATLILQPDVGLASRVQALEDKHEVFEAADKWRVSVFITSVGAIITGIAIASWELIKALSGFSK